MQNNWFVYMILADDDSLYTGITINIERRFTEHCNKKGAKYFYGRSPVKIVYREFGHNKSTALKREIEIKNLTRENKLALVSSYNDRQ